MKCNTLTQTMIMGPASLLFNFKLRRCVCDKGSLSHKGSATDQQCDSWEHERPLVKGLLDRTSFHSHRQDALRMDCEMAAEGTVEHTGHGGHVSNEGPHCCNAIAPYHSLGTHCLMKKDWSNVQQEHPRAFRVPGERDLVPGEEELTPFVCSPITCVNQLIWHSNGGCGEENSPYKRPAHTHRKHVPPISSMFHVGLSGTREREMLALCQQY